MGNNQSNKYGGMAIQTDMPYCISGTNITGKIYVQINEAFPAEKLKLEIKGKEKWKWYEQKSRTIHEGDTERVEHYEEKHDSDHTIFKHKATIYKFEGGYINPGQYVFPFSFMLPHDCPASAYYTGDSKAVGYIKYKCKGTFEAEDHTPFKDIKYKCHLVVRQVPYQVATNLVSLKEAEIYKCCCCCSQGPTKMGTLFEK